ncbi:MAG: hypothetical protein JWN73_4040 [Betaproteobacteria bacterium]|nr:hypothetical protein [Betaproteobacteria bacterium]
MYFILVIRLLVVAAALFTEMAWAGGGPPMITDDPGTPGNGNWEINLAAVTSHTAGKTDAELPLADFNYGIGERLQLKFEMPWAVQNLGGSYRSGAGNALAGVKWRFYDGGENAWQVSTYPQIEFRTPVSNFTHAGLADSGISHLAPLQFMRTFEGFDINFDIGRWFRPGARPDTWTAGFAVTREVQKGFELIAEVHEEAAVHQSQEELILNFGARYDFSPRYTLLLSTGRDLHNTLASTNTLLSYIGLQVHY